MVVFFKAYLYKIIFLYKKIWEFFLKLLKHNFFLKC